MSITRTSHIVPVLLAVVLSTGILRPQPAIAGPLTPDDMAQILRQMQGLQDLFAQTHRYQVEAQNLLREHAGLTAILPAVRTALQNARLAAILQRLGQLRPVLEGSLQAFQRFVASQSAASNLTQRAVAYAGELAAPAARALTLLGRLCIVYAIVDAIFISGATDARAAELPPWRNPRAPATSPTAMDTNIGAMIDDQTSSDPDDANAPKLNLLAMVLELDAIAVLRGQNAVHQELERFRQLLVVQARKQTAVLCFLDVGYRVLHRIDLATGASSTPLAEAWPGFRRCDAITGA